MHTKTLSCPGSLLRPSTVAAGNSEEEEEEEEEEKEEEKEEEMMVMNITVDKYRERKKQIQEQTLARRNVCLRKEQP